jgi:UDP-glucose 4-epimerase
LDKPNNLIPIITQTAIGKQKTFTVFGNDYKTRDGSCIRDYVHVCDIANAHVIALGHLLNSALNYDVFNLGTGQGVSVFEAITAFEKASGIKPNFIQGPRREGDVEAIYSDCRKATSILGWKAQIGLDEMMETAWKWELKLAEKK